MNNRIVYQLFWLALAAVSFANAADSSGKLPPLPGKAPVFARVTKVDEGAGTFNYVLLFDEIVSTETISTDAQGKSAKTSSGKVMTSLLEEKTDRPLQGLTISTGDGTANQFS